MSFPLDYEIIIYIIKPFPGIFKGGLSNNFPVPQYSSFWIICYDLDDQCNFSWCFAIQKQMIFKNINEDYNITVCVVFKVKYNIYSNWAENNKPSLHAHFNLMKFCLQNMLGQLDKQYHLNITLIFYYRYTMFFYFTYFAIVWDYGITKKILNQ